MNYPLLMLLYDVQYKTNGNNVHFLLLRYTETKFIL